MSGWSRQLAQVAGSRRFRFLLRSTRWRRVPANSRRASDLRKIRTLAPSTFSTTSTSNQLSIEGGRKRPLDEQALDEKGRQSGGLFCSVSPARPSRRVLHDESAFVDEHGAAPDPVHHADSV